MLAGKVVYDGALENDGGVIVIAKGVNNICPAGYKRSFSFSCKKCCLLAR